MNTQERKAMEQALEALESALSDDKPYIDKSKAAITALRQCLEQNPAAWVGLTDEERNKASGWSVKHIEEYLKEKNTGETK